MRHWSITVVAIIALMLGLFMMVTTRARAQDSRLFDALPAGVDVPPGLTAVDEGSRGASEIAAGFPDPSDAARRLDEWGWQENAYRTFATSDQQSPEGVVSLEVSLQQFADPASAAAAMPYFVEGRAAMLGLESSGPLTLAGPVPGGTEITTYAQQGAVLIRITAISASPEITGTLGEIQSLVRQRLALQRQGTYTSPQFGYQIDWDEDFVAIEGESSKPGVSDELMLRSIQDPAYFVVVGMPAVLPSIEPPEPTSPGQIYASPQFGYDVWRGAILHALYDLADGRALDYPGSTIAYTKDWGAGATIRYTASDGTAWVEDISVAPFVGGGGLAFFITGKTQALDEQYRPDLFYSIVVDLTAAVDREPPAVAPWGLDRLAGSSFSVESLADALPHSINGAFESLVLQEATRTPPVHGVPEGTTYRFGPVGSSAPTVTVVVNDGGFDRGDTAIPITPLDYMRQSTNAVLRFWEQSALLSEDVSPGAPVPFVLSNYASMISSASPDRFTLLWSVRGSGWAVEVQATNERDIEAIARVWVTNLAGIN
jgi:hypothetical protein